MAAWSIVLEMGWRIASSGGSDVAGTNIHAKRVFRKMLYLELKTGFKREHSRGLSRADDGRRVRHC
jgi:hypothetical protein